MSTNRERVTGLIDLRLAGGILEKKVRVYTDTFSDTFDLVSTSYVEEWRAVETVDAGSVAAANAADLTMQSAIAARRIAQRKIKTP